MKNIFRAAALVCMLAGCAAPPPETAAIRSIIPESDLYYCCASAAEPVRRVRELFAELDLTLQRSELPDRQKRQLCALLAACRMTLLKSGLSDELAFGISSVRAPDGGGFLTTRALAAGKASDGLVWTLFGRQARGIREELNSLPADTLAAFSFDLRSAEIAARIAEVAELFAGVPLRWEPIARTMSGRWRLLCRPGRPNLYCELTVPDRDRKLGDLLKTFFPPRADGVIRLPKSGSGAESVILLSDAELTLRIGSPSGADGGRLASLPEVESALRVLPETGAGWFYLAPGLIRGMALENDLMSDVTGCPRILAVLEARADALILRSYSDWDPLSEAWLLPVVLLGSRPFVELTVAGERARDRAQAHQEFRACAERLAGLGSAFRTYARARRGRFPAGHDIAGLRELLESERLSPEQFVCPAAHGDAPAKDAASFNYDNCSYVYIGGSGPQTPEDFPLVFDWPLNHPGRFHVLTVGGEVLSFSLKGLNSCRKLASFLQSRFRYPEADFRRLLDVADKLDAKFLKGHSK